MSTPIDPAAEAARVPDPPDPIDPLVEVWPAGQILHTCYDIRHSPGFYAPDDKHRRTYRFSDFGTPIVPTLYAGATEQTAVMETILGKAVAGATLPRPMYANRALATITPARDLNLAMLRGVGLPALGISARQLTDTEPLDVVYKRTVAWAKAIHAYQRTVTLHTAPTIVAEQGLDGMIWMSRPDNANASLILFGDRVRTQDLHILGPTRAFAATPDRDWLADLCAQMRVTLLP